MDLLNFSDTGFHFTKVEELFYPRTFHTISRAIFPAKPGNDFIKMPLGNESVEFLATNIKVENNNMNYATRLS
jgi:hypothetical protein